MVQDHLTCGLYCTFFGNLAVHHGVGDDLHNGKKKKKKKNQRNAGVQDTHSQLIQWASVLLQTSPGLRLGLVKAIS